MRNLQLSLAVVVGLFSLSSAQAATDSLDTNKNATVVVGSIADQYSNRGLDVQSPGDQDANGVFSPRREPIVLGQQAKELDSDISRTAVP